MMTLNFTPKCLSGSEWLIVIALAARSDENWFSSPSIRDLSQETGLSAQTCRKSLNTLSDQEFIIVEYSTGTANIYKIAPALQPLLIGFRPTPDTFYEGSDVSNEVKMDYQSNFPISQSNSGDIFDPSDGNPLYFLGGVINSIRGPINVNTYLSLSKDIIGFTIVNPIMGENFENPGPIPEDTGIPEPEISPESRDLHFGLFLDDTQMFEMQAIGAKIPEDVAEIPRPICEVSHSDGGGDPQPIQNPEYLSKFRHEIRDLAYAFAEKFGRGPTKGEYSFWVKGLREQLEIGLEPDDIRRAYDQMKKDRLTIKSPKSVTAIAYSLKTETRDNDPRKFARESGGVF